MDGGTCQLFLNMGPAGWILGAAVPPPYGLMVIPSLVGVPGQTAIAHMGGLAQVRLPYIVGEVAFDDHLEISPGSKHRYQE